MKSLEKALRDRLNKMMWSQGKTIYELAIWRVFDHELGDVSWHIDTIPGYLNYRPGTYTKTWISLDEFIKEAIDHGYTGSAADIESLIENGI